MIPKDWIKEAAEEIVSVTYSGEYPLEDEVQSVIKKHVPFKIDGTHMLAVRCDQCKHWQQFELENSGKCLEANRTILFHAGNCGLETKDDFGCVRWEAK